MPSTLKIGELARRADVSVDTVRFYERRGVLKPPRRRPSGYRSYDESTVQRLRLVRSLQTLGMSLDEIIEAFEAMDGGRANCKGQQQRLQGALGRIDQQIAQLQSTRQRAQRVLSRCQAGDCDLPECGCD